MLWPALFNVGWASVQISNMSLVINITASQQRRDRLVSGRNAFTYIAGIGILILMLALFAIVSDPTQQFYIMVYSVTAVGVVCSVMYLIGVPEIALSKKSDYHDKAYQAKKKQLEGDSEGTPLLSGRSDQVEEIDTSTKPMNEQADKPKKGKTAGDWLKDGSFYLHGGIYMFVRLAMNLAMSVIPFYLTYVLGVAEPSPENGSPVIVALVPLVSFLCSALFSIFAYKSVIAYFGNRLIPLFLGALTIAAGSIPFLFM